MIDTVRDGILGVRAAWMTPETIEHRLAELLHAPDVARVAARADGARFAVRAAHAALARLARIGGGQWRNTCLYRSVAECLVLRARGLPARVAIGVGADESAVGVMAHAWVECDGIACVSTRGAAELERLTTSSR